MLGSKEWANDQLKFGISELRTSHLKSVFVWKNTMHLVLIIKEGLEDHDYVWQARVLEYWIHKYQKARREASLTSSLATPEVSTLQKREERLSF